MKTLDLTQAAELLNVHPLTVQRRAAAGEIPGAKIGRAWVFIDEDLIDYIRSKYTSSRQDASKEENMLVKRTTAMISAVLRKAHRVWGWTENTPYIRKFKEDNKRVRWLTSDEAERLLSELPSHTRAMAIFTLATGLRESNVTGLEWSQIDMQNRLAWIYADQSKTGTPLNVFQELGGWSDYRMVLRYAHIAPEHLAEREGFEPSIR